MEIAVNGDDIPDVGEIRQWVQAALAGADAGGNFDVAVRVIDSSEMQQLNRRYRQQDKSTNVLSFPAGNVAGLPDGARRSLGDIAVCADLVREEALQQGKAIADHWAHMLVHGSLHLLGYDHETGEEARDMESLEIRILESGGISDPYRVR
ncbi:MAG: rRNA maturation RNase YbeY [Woeseiaceae bacterium]|nr:rRNA maturation RNase YbeY [Woeseiaceae bacterium]